MNAALTEKQLAIMDLVFKGARVGGFIDIDELMERLAYDRMPTKQAIQCSIRFLERHGLIEREYAARRGRRRMIIKPTAIAFVYLRGERVISGEPKKTGSVLVPAVESLLDSK